MSFCILLSDITCAMLWCSRMLFYNEIMFLYCMMIIDFQLNCAQATAEPTVPISAGNESITTMETRIEAASAEEAVSLLASTLCTQFPSYFSNYSVLILIATTVITQLSHVCKICLMTIIAGMLRVLVLLCF